MSKSKSITDSSEGVNQVSPSIAKTNKDFISPEQNINILHSNFKSQNPQ